MKRDRTKLTEVRNPTPQEKKRGAEVVFIRTDESNREHIILGCVCCESWEQWGVSSDILGDNVDQIEQWRKKQSN
jgi:hypothetical protein